MASAPRPPDRGVPVPGQVRAPARQRPRVVHAQVSPGAAPRARRPHRPHDVTGDGQLPSGKHVPADEARRSSPGWVLSWWVDAVVEQRAAGAQPGAQEAEIGRVVAHADVLDGPIALTASKSRSGTARIVQVPQLGRSRGPPRRCGLAQSACSGDSVTPRAAPRKWSRRAAPSRPSRSRRRAGASRPEPELAGDPRTCLLRRSRVALSVG